MLNAPRWRRQTLVPHDSGTAELLGHPETPRRSDMGHIDVLAAVYLTTVRGFDLKQIAMFAWLPFLAADLGCMFGGTISIGGTPSTRLGITSTSAIINSGGATDFCARFLDGAYRPVKDIRVTFTGRE